MHVYLDVCWKMETLYFVPHFEISLTHLINNNHEMGRCNLWSIKQWLKLAIYLAFSSDGDLLKS